MYTSGSTFIKKIKPFVCHYITRIFFNKKPVKEHSIDNAERIILKAVLASFIKHLLLNLFLADRGLLMGAIKKQQTIMQVKKSKKKNKMPHC